jgi:hypothetical protein
LISIAISTGNRAALAVPASIVLTKTVGTEDGICAATKEITVPAGTLVTYCYVVQNTGLITFMTHTLTDSRLGVLVGPNAIQALPAGQIIQVLAQSPIVTDTVNTAEWAARVSVITSTSTSMATVTVTETGAAGCSDTIDNDGDGFIDCLDPECVGDPVCVAQAPTLGTPALLFSALLLLAIGGFALVARRRA